MFIESSRYYKVRKEDATAKDGRTVKVVALRRLPATTGGPVVLSDNDRLDILAQRLYDNPAKFWYIADANTELWANDLLKVSNRTINAPER